MDIWHTWLGFIGLICGLAVPTVLRVPIIWSSLAGLVAGVALAALWNVADPSVPCLQNAKGRDILRAYSLTCRDPLAEQLLRNAPQR